MLRFGNDRIGVIQQENTVVDVTDALATAGRA
jgi:hypothetical protein